MGHIDIEILMEINEEIKSICKENHLPYSFKVDHGSFETAIEFWAMGYFHPPKSNSWEEAKREEREIKCPDLLDYTHKKIIEMEEEGQKRRTGAKLSTKGHGRSGDISNSRDTNRDYLYRIGGFSVHKVWESDYIANTWKSKLNDFLIQSSDTKLI